MSDPKRTLKGTNRRVTVDVSQATIDRAEERDSSHCMVADAVRAAIPEAESVSVDLVTIRFTDRSKHQRYIYLTPLRVQQALVDFDQGRHNEPFKFVLAKAVQVVEAGRRAGSDGQKTKMASRAVQGVVGASGRNQPTKLGGTLPPVGALSSKGSRRKGSVAAVSAPAATAKVTPKRPTAAEKRAAATRKAEQQVAARDRGEPVTKTGSNITLAATPSRVRRFGMKQIRA